MNRYFAFGGGQQSMAVLVLSALKKIDPYRAYIFANVGHDSENPDTLRYFNEVAMPYARRHNLNLVEIHKKLKGKDTTLYQYAIETPRSIPLPARMSNGAPGNRSCTQDFKIRNIAAFIRNKFNDRDYIIGIGFSTDEIHRARLPIREEVIYKVRQILEYPLIDLRLSRSQCQTIITNASLPVPPKSSCFFCPFHSPAEWLRLRETRPDLFRKSVELEQILNNRRRDLGKDHVYFHPSLQPLNEAVGRQMLLPFDETEICNLGSCFT